MCRDYATASRTVVNPTAADHLDIRTHCSYNAAVLLQALCSIRVLRVWVRVWKGGVALGLFVVVWGRVAPCGLPPPRISGFFFSVRA